MSDEWPSRREFRKLDRQVEKVERVRGEPVEEFEFAASEAWQNLTGRDGYLPVLLLIFASMISIPLIGDSPVGSLVNVALASCGLLLTVFRSTSRPRLRRASALVLSVASGLSIVGVVFLAGESQSHDALHIFLTSAYLVMLLLCFPMVIIRSFQHRKVSVNTVCATLTAYLIIGLIFMATYRLFGEFTPFFSQYQTTSPTPGQYAYFSFITLTTVGYGDLTPGSDAARSIVMVEAVLGQVFLVTTMARVISLLGDERQVRLADSRERAAAKAAAATSDTTAAADSPTADRDEQDPAE
jgi:uncharacterized membrane protein